MRSVAPILSRVPLRFLLVGSLLMVAAFSLLVANMTAERIIAGIDRAQTSGISSLDAGPAAFALVTVVCILGFAMAIAAVIGSVVRARVADVRVATERIAGGSFDVRMPPQPADEIGRLAACINEMAEQLQRLDTSRNDLLARISHELRTPLTVIMSAAFTLARHEADAQRLSTLDLIQHEADRTAAMVSDLLTAASLQARGMQLQPEPERAADVVEGIVERFASAAAAQNVKLVAQVDDSDICVVCDRHRMHQVLSNLVSNALRHAPAGSDVTVVATTPRPRTAHFEVRDAGPGIATDDIGRIFEPFHQGANPTGAMGLGLAIARDLVRMHNGDLTVTSQPGDTRFVIALPCLPERHARVAVDPPRAMQTRLAAGT